MQSKRIDFSLLPANERTPTHYNARILFNGIERHPSLQKHIECILFFLWVVSAQRDTLVTVREGALRAALSEFVLLIRAFADERSLNEWNDVYEVNPIFHLMKMLRNTQLHLVNLHFSSETIQLRYEEEKAHSIIGDHEQTVYITQDLNFDSLMKWRDRTRYHREDLERLFRWYNCEQRKFGTHNVVFLGLSEFVYRKLFCK